MTRKSFGSTGRATREGKLCVAEEKHDNWETVQTVTTGLGTKTLDIDNQAHKILNGECFGGEIMDALREAGTGLGADRLEVLLTRTLLVRVMESMGETYPAEVLQNYDNRMRISEALRYLREAIASTGPQETTSSENDNGDYPMAHR